MGASRAKEDALQECALDVGKMMAALMAKYKRQPGMLAHCLVDSLGAYVAMVSDKPQESLEKIAERLKVVDHAQIRTRFFGWRIGVINGGETVDDRTESNPDNGRCERDRSESGEGGRDLGRAPDQGDSEEPTAS